MPITLQPPANKIAAHGMIDCSEKFAPIMNIAGIDLLLAGHTHQFKVIAPQKGVTTFPIIVGGAPVKENDQTNTTYTFIEVGKLGITCSLKKANGNVIETFMITKRNSYKLFDPALNCNNIVPAFISQQSTMQFQNFKYLIKL